MEKKVCKCGHSDIIHEYYTDTCHAKGCSCLSFQEPNSDPPSPEMVCQCGHDVKEHFEGGGEVTYCEHNDASSYCRCPKFIPVSQVPSPEPPEKVRAEIANEFINIVPRECSICKGTGWLPDPPESYFNQHECEYCKGLGKLPSLDTRLAKADSIILKLQQAGWGDIQHILDTDAELLHEQEARIKELETELRTLKERDLARIITIDECKKRLEVLDKKLSNTELAIAQAKAEAYKEIGDAIDKTENPYKSKGVFGGEYHGTDYGVFEIARQSFKEVITKLQNGETLSK